MTFEYVSDELDAMACATNYYRWIMGAFRPYLSGTVLELGAGIGTFSSHLINESIERLVLVEPATALCERLRRRFASDPRVAVRHGVLEDVQDDANAIVSVNVFEHIPDDAATVRTAYRRLYSGGTLLVFVPALPWLYSPMDRHFGHFRRYARPGLHELLRGAGFAIERLAYVNMLGAVAWLMSGLILRRKTLTPAMVKLNDRILIPVAARFERRLQPPLGQSLIAVARKPAR